MKRKRILTIRYVVVVMLISGLASVIFAFVSEENKGAKATSHSRPIHVGIDSSEIHRYASHHLLHDKLTYYTYRPSSLNDSMQIMFVMHGNDRNAMDYLEAWREFADEHNYVIVAPLFEEIVEGETYDYQEGNIWNQHHEWNPREDWAFSTVDRIFNELKTNNGFVADSFLIFGHSAGAQFVHRMLLFMPEAPIKMAIAANAGWYTFPDFTIKFPYGIMNTTINDQTLAKTFSMKLFVLLGAEDTNKEHLRQTKNAIKQGKSRIARGTKFYNCSEALAKSKDYRFNWQLKVVENVAHNYVLMSKEAQKIILNH